MPCISTRDWVSLLPTDSSHTRQTTVLVFCLSVFLFAILSSNMKVDDEVCSLIFALIVPDQEVANYAFCRFNLSSVMLHCFIPLNDDDECLICSLSLLSLPLVLSSLVVVTLLISERDHHHRVMHRVTLFSPEAV